MRQHVIRIRVSEHERTNLSARAHARGISLSELLRWSGGGVRLPAAHFDQRQAGLLAELIGQLARIGSNLNQLTRAANSRRLVGHSDELSATIAEINVVRARVRELLV